MTDFADKIRQLEIDLATANANLARFQNALGANNNAEVNEIPALAPTVAAIYRQPKIPAFCRDNPHTWFLQAEITLRNAGVRNSVTKTDFIAEKLDLEALQVVQDLMSLDPAPVDIYEQVKERLIATFGTSAEERLRKFIKGQVYSGGKPSLMLNALRALRVNCGNDILKTVFLENLPSNCRAALSVAGIEDLNKLAEMADKFIEAMDPDLHAVTAVSTQASSAEKFSSEVARLSAELAELKVQGGRARSRIRFKPRDKANTVVGDESTKALQPGLCRLHRKYGAQAFRCYKPCTWKPQQEN